MSLVRTALLSTLSAVMLALAVPAPAARAELDPGWYAVCSKLVKVPSRRAAERKCKRGEVVHLDAETRPAFWVAGYYYAGATKAKATAACKREERAYKAKGRSRADEDWGCTNMIRAVYGPFERKTHDEYDDGLLYNYLNEEGYWVDSRGEGPCFVSGTLVATPDGDKPIETFVPGDEVWSWSPEERRLVTARVAHVKPRRVTSVLALTTAGGQVVRATANHPLWSPSRAAWVPTGELRVGDTLAARAGDGIAPVAITAIEPESATPTGSELDVWDLTIAPTHTYFAGGIWAHNY